MSNFYCEHCGKDSEDEYVIGCEHYPLDNHEKENIETYTTNGYIWSNQHLTRIRK